jgi:hypothetical protein
MDRKEVRCDGVVWIYLSQDRPIDRPLEKHGTKSTLQPIEQLYIFRCQLRHFYLLRNVITTYR